MPGNLVVVGDNSRVGGGGGHQGPGQFPVQGGWPDEAPSGHRNYGGGGRNNYRGNFSGRGT